MVLLIDKNGKQPRESCTKEKMVYLIDKTENNLGKIVGGNIFAGDCLIWGEEGGKPALLRYCPLSPQELCLTRVVGG